jgi:hypothetical protein
MKPARLLLIVLAVSLPGRAHADDLKVCSTSGGLDKCSTAPGAPTACHVDSSRVLATLKNSHSGCDFIIEASSSTNLTLPYFRLSLVAVPTPLSAEHRRCYLQPCGGNNSILGAIVNTPSTIRTVSCTKRGSGLGNVNVSYDQSLDCP